MHSHVERKMTKERKVSCPSSLIPDVSTPTPVQRYNLPPHRQAPEALKRPPSVVHGGVPEKRVSTYPRSQKYEAPLYTLRVTYDGASHELEYVTRCPTDSLFNLLADDVCSSAKIPKDQQVYHVDGKNGRVLNRFDALSSLQLPSTSVKIFVATKKTNLNPLVNNSSRKTHPCIRQLGRCKEAEDCRYKDTPDDVCIGWLKNQSCSVPSCPYKHLALTQPQQGRPAPINVDEEDDEEIDTHHQTLSISAPRGPLNPSPTQQHPTQQPNQTRKHALDCASKKVIRVERPKIQPHLTTCPHCREPDQTHLHTLNCVAQFCAPPQEPEGALRSSPDDSRELEALGVQAGPDRSKVAKVHVVPGPEVGTRGLPALAQKRPAMGTTTEDEMGHDRTKVVAKRMRSPTRSIEDPSLESRMKRSTKTCQMEHGRDLLTEHDTKSVGVGGERCASRCPCGQLNAWAATPYCPHDGRPHYMYNDMTLHRIPNLLVTVPPSTRKETVLDVTTPWEVTQPRLMELASFSTHTLGGDEILFLCVSQSGFRKAANSHRFYGSYRIPDKKENDEIDKEGTGDDRSEHTLASSDDLGSHGDDLYAAETLELMSLEMALLDDTYQEDGRVYCRRTFVEPVMVVEEEESLRVTMVPRVPKVQLGGVGGKVVVVNKVR